MLDIRVNLVPEEIASDPEDTGASTPMGSSSSEESSVESTFEGTLAALTQMLDIRADIIPEEISSDSAMSHGEEQSSSNESDSEESMSHSSSDLFVPDSPVAVISREILGEPVADGNASGDSICFCFLLFAY